MWKFIVLLILLIPFVSAQDIEAEAEEIQALIEEEFSDIFGPNPGERMMIVKGTQLSGPERLAIEVLKAKAPRAEIVEALVVTDDEQALEEAKTGSKAVFVVGGPSQNLVAKGLIKEGLVQTPTIPKGKLLATARGFNQQDQKILVISDVRGFKNVEREGARLSPLAKFIPIEYVPAAASLIVIILTALFNFFRVFEGKFLASLGQKRAEMKQKYSGFQIKHFHVKYREYVAIIIAALIFGLAIAISFTGFQPELIKTFQITAAVTLSIYFLKETTRLFLSYISKLHSEYVIWYPGVVLAIFGGWLGNPMNSTGFVLEDKDKNYSAVKSARIKYSIVILMFIGGLVFSILNLIYPSQYYQMILVAATTAAVAELMPFKPMYGVALKQWRPWTWFLTLVLFSILYVLVNFVV